MSEQIGEFSALLHQIQAREASGFLRESVDAEQLAEHEAGIVEAKRLIKVTRQQVFLHHLPTALPSQFGLLTTKRPCEKTKLLRRQVFSKSQEPKIAGS